MIIPEHALPAACHNMQTCIPAHAARLSGWCMLLQIRPWSSGVACGWLLPSVCRRSSQQGTLPTVELMKPHMGLEQPLACMQRAILAALAAKLTRCFSTSGPPWPARSGSVAQGQMCHCSGAA